MSCHSLSPLSSSSSFLFPKPKPRPFRRPPRFHSHPHSITATLSLPAADDDDDTKRPAARFHFLNFSATLTVIAASLPQPESAIAAVKEKRPKKSAAKKPEALSPQEVKAWSQGLPVVTSRIPYSELLRLKRAGRLKHVIKPPGIDLRENAEAVLVVTDEYRVSRTVLPFMRNDRKFWEEWDSLNMNSLCINAYTPPVKRPVAPSSYLGFLSTLLDSLLSKSVSMVKPKKESRKAAELRQLRNELKKQSEEDRMKAILETQLAEKAAKKQRIEEERRKQEARKEAHRVILRKAGKVSSTGAAKWQNLADDQTVASLLGAFFFLVFYQVVVLSYKKQKKDYDERLKIERAETEERKKKRELQREMNAIVSGEMELDEMEQGKGEDNPYMKLAKQFMKSGARVRRAPNPRLPEYLGKGNVKFEDVAGLGKIRLELEEIVKFFTHGEMYRRRGVKIPGGILLCGPPGVGKTLLAKAVAGEAGVNFFTISASQFVEIYVGVGASRVRALYQEARDHAPSVVFIDELDAVGRERGLIKGSGGQERDATLNQLLVSLDGFEGRGEVITIASTNRPDILDPALVRPGRFDRKIFIPKPGLIGRIEILKVHARKKPMAEDVDYMAIASMTDGMVGADLANVVEVAAINMIRDGRTEITTDDLLQAAQMEERGMLDRKERKPETWKRIAINEAATAVAAMNFPDQNNVQFLTIDPRAGRELGYVRIKMDPVRFNEGMLTRQSVLDYITVQLAPRAADAIYFGEDQLSTIWAEAADNARSAARTFVLGGLSDKHYGISNFWVADRINDLDTQALHIVNMCYERSKEILNRNRKLMDAVVDELVEKKSLAKQDFLRLVELHGRLNPMPISILDLRVAKRKQSEELLAKQNKTALGSNV